MKGSVKKILIFVLIAAVVVVAYVFISGKADVSGIPGISGSGDNSGLVSVNTGQDVGGLDDFGDTSLPSSQFNLNNLSQEFIAVLLSIKNIDLDNSIFATDSFGTLEDFTVPILQPDETGRVNPFAPIGFDVVDIDGFVEDGDVESILGIGLTGQSITQGTADWVEYDIFSGGSFFAPETWSVQFTMSELYKVSPQENSASFVVIGESEVIEIVYGDGGECFESDEMYVSCSFGQDPETERFLQIINFY